MTRIARENTPGALTHVVSRFAARGVRLRDDGDRVNYLSRVESAMAESDWQLLAYALMPDRIHWLAIAGHTPLSEFVKRMHSGFAVWINRHQQRTGRVFAERPRTLESNLCEALDLVAFIHNSPVREGHAAAAEESAWTSHRAYLGRAPEPSWLAVDRGLALCGAAPTPDGRQRFAAEVEARRTRSALMVRPSGAVRAALIERAISAPRRWDGPIDDVLDEVGRLSGIEPARIRSSDRSRDVVGARRVALLVGTRHLGRTLAEMAQVVGISASSASRLARSTPARLNAACLQAERVAETLMHPADGESAGPEDASSDQHEEEEAAGHTEPGEPVRDPHRDHALTAKLLSRLTTCLLLAATASGVIACEGSGQECRCGSAWTESALECSSAGRCEGGFELVGHSDLHGRGMNAALAVIGDHVYVGSRTDGVYHENGGVLIVDVSDPSEPEIVGEIGPPDESLLGISSRELRGVPDRDLLVVQDLVCRPGRDDCSRDLHTNPTTGGIAETDKLKVFDTADPVSPRLLGAYDFGYHPDILEDPNNPHEFFLWRDPADPDRLLAYVVLYPGNPDVQVIDISSPSEPRLLTTLDFYAATGLEEDVTGLVHSGAVSPDGTVLYLASYGSGFLMIDSSDVAANLPSPKLRLEMPVENRIDLSPPLWPATHSAVPIPGRDLVLLTEEVFPVFAGYGCPWGWGWMVDVSDRTAPRLFTSSTGGEIHGQLRLPENDPEQCEPPELQLGVTYTSHNPTPTENVAFITWYAGGLQAFDISDPAAPVQVAAFYPEPLPRVVTEDPVLGGSPVAMWSYPIIKDGLIYVTDVRNGLYILRYTGPFADEVAEIAFLEGNSNLR